MKQQKKKKGRSVQDLLGIKTFTKYGLSTNKGELLFYLVSPTNISVLSHTNIEIKIRHLMMVLSALPDIEIVCTDSSECFDDNKAYLTERLKAEENDVGIKGGIKVSWKEDACIGCGVCVKACRQGAITLEDGKISVDNSKCNYCGRCFKACPTDAWDTIHGYIVSFGGLFGNSINKGETIIPFIENKEKLMEICDAALNFFAENAKPSERFKFTIDRVGREKFEQRILEVYNG